MSSESIQSAEPPMHPFTRDDADIVLRSSDGVKFCVHRLVLMLASPIMQDLLSVPQPASAAPDGSETTDDGKPIIDMHGEDAQMLEGVLRECYPNMESTAQKDLGILIKVLVMAVKFEMEGLTKRMELFLQQETIIKSDPLRAYAIACRFGLRLAAEAAAKESLLHPGLSDSYPDEYEGMSAVHLHKLFAYRERCIRVLDDILIKDQVWDQILGKPVRKPSWFKCTPVFNSNCRFSTNTPSFIVMLKLQQNMYKDCSTWFIDHIERTRAAFAQAVAGSTVASLQQLSRTCMTIRKNDLECECAKQAPYHLLLFTAELAEQVDRALSQIKLDPATTIPKGNPVPAAV